MLEKYYMYKAKYADYLLLIRAGNFYEVIEKDALILNEIFNYKIKRISNTFKSGFPCNSLDKVLNELDLKQINYIVIDGDMKKKMHYKNNSYGNYVMDPNKVIFNFIRKKKITKYLNDNVLNNNIDNILDEMERLI